MKAEEEKISVLVVEDHLVTLEGLIAGLSNDPGLEIVGSAGTSDEGLALARQVNPRIVLLDLHLPGSLGPKATIKAFSQLPQSKIVVFSGESRGPIVSLVLEAGASAYLLKSEGIPKIARAIRDAVSGKRVLSDEVASVDWNLTKSEQEILSMLARGLKYDEIASKRTSSPATVRKQCELLLEKLSIENRERLIAWAVDNGYRDLEV